MQLRAMREADLERMRGAIRPGTISGGAGGGH